MVRVKFVNKPTLEKYKELVAYFALKAKLEQAPGWPLDASYAVTLDVAFHNRRVKDADRVANTVLDACKRILWSDDRWTQVPSVLIASRLDREAPGVGVSVRVIGFP